VSPAGRAGGAEPKTPESAGQMLALGRDFLERKGCEEARLEAELLVAHVLGLDRLGLFMQLDRPLQGVEVERARELFARRGKREPVAYLIGRREFYGRDFEVGPGVLIPRPETELLVDRAREWAAEREGGELRVAELGCGSGCIAVTLALELEGARVLAVDLAPEAVEATGRNAERLGAELEVLAGEGLELLGGRAPFDLVVSNPPYVQPAEAELLAPEVREFEPGLALFAPDGDPDFFVRELAGRAHRWLAPGGAMLVELGHRQSERALELSRGAGLEATCHEDLERVPRVLELTRPRPG